jgi:hypothetical protein
LFFDGLAGGLVCLSFFDVPESRSSGPAQGEHRHIAKRCVDKIHLNLPFGKYFSASPVPLRIAPVCAGSLGGFYEKEFWMWR